MIFEDGGLESFPPLEQIDFTALTGHLIASPWHLVQFVTDAVQHIQVSLWGRLSSLPVLKCLSWQAGKPAPHSTIPNT